jgi:hypothetical protein
LIPDSVPEQFRQPSDAAKRCADIVTLASIAGMAGKFMAIRLQDGGSDQVPYDTREDAIRHQLNPERCTYVLVPPSAMGAHEAEALLDYWRKLADSGVRDDDPAVPMPLMPLLAADRRRQIRALSKGRR